MGSEAARGVARAARRASFAVQVNLSRNRGPKARLKRGGRSARDYSKYRQFSIVDTFVAMMDRDFLTADVLL